MTRYRSPAQRRRWQRDNSIASALCQQGATLRAVANLFGVSAATVAMVKLRTFGYGPTGTPCPVLAG